MAEIKSLTSLRGIFAMWVLGYHLRILAPAPIYDPAGFPSQRISGVDFFFLLSGFILAAVYGNRFSAEFDFREWLRFLTCRAGRLFPLHLAVITACVVGAYTVGQPYSPIQVVQEATLIHRWPLVHALFNSINGPAWSISTEWLANIFFPVFAVASLSRSRMSAIATGGTAVITIALLSWRHSGSLDLSLANTLSPTLRCFSEFSLGMLIYRWRSVGLPSDMMAGSLLCLLVLAILVGLPDAVIVMIMVPTIISVSNNVGLVQASLSAKGWHWLGELSFSIYLVHLLVMMIIRWLCRDHAPTYVLDIMFVAASLAATLGISVCTYYSIEIYGREASKRLAGSLFLAHAVVT